MRHFTYLKPGSARDRDEIFSLSQHPRQCDLSGGGIILLADLLQPVRDLEDVGEVLLRIPRDYLAEVSILEVIRRFLRRKLAGLHDVQKRFVHKTASEQAPSKGRVSNDLHAEFPRGLQKPDGLPFDVQGERRVLYLDGRDWVHCVCPAEGRSGDLRKPNVFDLPGSRVGSGSCLCIKDGIVTHLTSSAIAATVCSIGTVLSAR